jgi:nicotinamidase-related amidase
MVSFEINPRRTAALCIDLQNCFVENSPIAAPDGLAVVANLNRLAGECRKAGGTIVWTRHVVRPDHSNLGILGRTVPPVRAGVIDDGSDGAALHRAVQVEPGDIILAKPQFGAFQSTELESILRARNIDTVIIGGIATNFCCETTAREAHGREFNVVFLSDGTATFDLPSVEGALIHRNDVQKSTLATLAFGFAEVIATDVAIAKLRAS